MANYDFFDVFPDLKGKCSINKRIMITNASIDKETLSIALSFSSNYEISDDEIKIIEESLVSFYGFNKVDINIESNQFDFFEKALKTTVERMSFAVPLLRDYKYTVDDKNNNITITLSNGGLEYLKSKSFPDILMSNIQTETGKKYSILFDGKTEVDNTISTEELIKLSTDNKSTTAEETEKVVLGNKITKPVVEMSSVDIDSGRVVVEGDIFNIDSRESYDKLRLRSTIYITDNTSSFAVKIDDYKDKMAHVIEQLEKSKRIRVRGIVKFDKYFNDICIFADDITVVPKVVVKDTSEEKRVELHLHTNMSSMDGVAEIDQYVRRASEWGHKAIAVTDHGVVQSFPAAASASKKYGVKMIYGIEDYLINDMVPAFVGDVDISLENEFIVFDIETTGTAFEIDRITEIAAVKFENGNIVDEFQTFCNPEKPISEKIQSLTGITDDMVKDAPLEGEAVKSFLNFCGDRVLVAHNASFDTGFIKNACLRNNIKFSNSHIDTVPLCRKFYPSLKNVKLDTVSQHLGYGDFNHHRAIDDTKVLAAIFRDIVLHLNEIGVESTVGINGILNDINTNSLHSFHHIILVKNEIGRKNLYKLVSSSHLNNFKKNPRMRKSELISRREGLIFGSACVEGEVYQAFLDMKNYDEIKRIASFYDYLEIQPLSNNEFLINSEKVESVNSIEDIIEINKKIVQLGDDLGIPVVATGDVHFLNKTDSVYREILMEAVGFSSDDTKSELYFRSTDDMLKEFSYLGEEKAFEVVVTNTNLIADMVDEIIPIPEGTFTPSIDGSDETFKNSTYEKAHEIYGDPLPDIVEKRLEKEVNSIITNGFSVMYTAAQDIVNYSKKNGYIVGSRGSVGSSFAATMAGITEINPLPPHYVCKNCKYSEFIADGSVKSGYELSEKNCPKCGSPLIGDGQDIPFETFLGFKGEKAPDIDLNISGEFQHSVHKHVEEMFGAENCYKAGTISLAKENTAYGFVKKYLEKRGMVVNSAEMKRLEIGATGTKRTTGQHPGGIVVVPKKYEIEDFTPVQHPADKSESDIVTTHFDFNSMHDTLLKLDLLGHDVPTLAKYLSESTGVAFTDVPLNDEKVMSLFTSPEALGVTEQQINCETGTLGLPEMGTSFVRQMLIESQPKTFSDLLQISGLSHGTDVWLGNAQDLIKNGTCSISEVIGTRDNIMVYLMYKGLPSDRAFSIMEKVRKKNKTISEDDEQLMISYGVPDWYLDSCKKIQYMFPKAHAAAYVMSAIRLGWYKVYKPKDFYAAMFTVRPDGFDAVVASKGDLYMKRERERLLLKEQETGKKKSQNDENMLKALDLSIEMCERGIKFLPIDLNKSHSYKFLIEDEGIRMPFIALPGLGEAAANAIVEARDNGGFATQEDVENVAGLSKTIIDIMDGLGVFKDIPKSSQLTFF